MKYNDQKFDFDLSIFNKNTVKMLRYSWKDAASDYTDEYETATGLYKYKVFRFIDIVWCFFRYGCPGNNYKSFQFYKLNHHTRNSFYTFRRRIKLIQSNLISMYMIYSKIKRGSMSSLGILYIGIGYISVRTVLGRILQSF